MKLGELLGADDFDVGAAIRLQALDESLGRGVALALVAGDRLLLALAFGVDTVGFDALGDQVFLDRGSALLGQLLVVGIGTDAVSVTDDQDHFELDGGSLGDQLVELGLAGGTQGGLVEVEQRVGSDGDLLGGRLRHGGNRGSRCRRLADFLGQQVFVALAASRILGGSRRGPVAGAPAEAEAAQGDDVALVDDINALLSMIGGGSGADAGQDGQNERFLGVVDHEGFPVKKN